MQSRTSHALPRSGLGRLSLRRRLGLALMLALQLSGLIGIAAPRWAAAITCPSTDLACDAFNRTVTGGWGTADVGGAWNKSGPAYAVAPGGATIKADNTTPSNFLAGVSAQDADLLAEVTPPPISNAQTAAVGFGLRYASTSGTWYQFDAYYATGNNANNYTVQLKRKPDDAWIRPEFQTTMAGGSAFWVRFEAQGTYPTTLRWKMWLNGTAEPASWTDTGTDANAAEQTAGGVGAVAYVTSGKTTVTFNSLELTAIASTPPVLITCPAGAVACDSFNRTASASWGSADVGGAWNTSGAPYAVQPGAGKITADTTTPANFLASVSVQDVDLLGKVTPPPLNNTQTVAVGFGVRYSSSTASWYQVDAYYAAGANAGNYTVQLKRKPDNVAIRPEVQTRLAGGSPFWIRLQAQGINPTTLRWKMWLDATTEPAAWTDSGIDANAPQQVSGGVGVVSYVTSGQSIVQFNGLVVTAITSTPVIIACPTGTVACDSFNRSARGTWGTADTGGAWNTSGAAYSVTPGQGVIQADSTTPSNFLNVSVQDVDVVVKITPPPITPSQTVDIGPVVRYAQASGSWYQVNAYAAGNNNNNLTVQLKHKPDNTLIRPEFPTTVPGGSPFWLRLDALGTSPTLLRWKAWADGSQEPSAWTDSGVDASATQQTAGGVGVVAFATSGTASVAFNSFIATQIPPATCPTSAIACDLFNRTVTAGWGTANVGGAWNSTDPAFSVTPGTGQEITQSYRENDLTAMTATQDVDYLARVTLPASSSATCNLTLRRTSASGSAFYFAGAWWDSAQAKVQLYLKYQDAGGTNSTLAPDTVSAIGGSLPPPMWLRVQAVGVNPTLLHARVWADGTPEPGTWLVSASSADAGVQGPGFVGFGCNSSGNDTFKLSQVVVSAPPSSPGPHGAACAPSDVACDTYNRSIAGGWGSADLGGAWSIVDTPANWSVTPGSGTVNVAAAGAERAYLGTVSAQDVEIVTQVVLPKAAQNNEVAYVLGRYIAGTTPTYYRVGIGQGIASSNAFIRAQRNDGTMIGADAPTAIAATNNLVVWLRVQFQGVNPTAIRARAWVDGGTEPPLWALDTTDSTAAEQAAASVGVRLRNEDTAAAHPFTVQRYEVAPMAARPALPAGFAVDSFNRTVTGGWGTADVGGPWNATGSIYNVTPGRATIVASTTVPSNFLTTATAQNVEALAWISPAPVSGATGDVGLLVRYQAATGAFYQVSAYYPSTLNGANYVVQLKRKPENVQIRPDFNTAIPGGTAIWLRFRAEGVNPTVLSWKLWQDGTAEPAAWTDSGQDSTAGLQAPGAVGFNCYVSGGTVTPAFNALSARTF